MTRHPTTILALLALTSAAIAQDVQLLSPDISFEAREVFFRRPPTYLAADGTKRHAKTALKLLLTGKDFYDGASGPRYYLGKLRADAHYTSPDGRQVAVYFYDPVRLPRETELRVETHVGRFLSAKQPFQLEAVNWLQPAVRERHDLPDLRARLLGNSRD